MKKLVGFVIILACPAIVVSSENGIAASVPQIKVQIPTVHVHVTPPPAAARTNTTPHDSKQFLLNQKLTTQGTFKGTSTKGTSASIGGETVRKTGPYSLTNKTEPSLIDNVGYPSLDASSKNTLVFNVYPSYSFNKIDPTGKASIVFVNQPDGAGRTDPTDSGKVTFNHFPVTSAPSFSFAKPAANGNENIYYTIVLTNSAIVPYSTFHGAAPNITPVGGVLKENVGGLNTIIGGTKTENAGGTKTLDRNRFQDGAIH
jgi:hypothetical protein